MWKGGQLSLTLEHSSAVWGLAFVKEDHYITTSDKEIMLWERLTIKRKFSGHIDCVRDVVMLDESKFASCSNDGYGILPKAL